MKKLLTLLSLLPISVFAQSGIYFSLEDGYWLPCSSGKQVSNHSYSSSYSSTSGSSTSHYKLVPYSLGMGNVTQLRIGYSWNNGFGLEGGAGYLIGAPFKQESSYYSINNYSYTDERNETEAVTLKATGARSMIGLSYTANLNERLILQLSTGANVGMMLKNTVTDVYASTYNHVSFLTGLDTTEYHSERRVIEYDQGLAWGAYSAIELQYRIKGAWSAGLRASILMGSWGPKHGVITTYTIDGVDQLAGMDVSDKEADFVDELDETTTSTGNPNPNVPAKALRYFYSFNSAGAMFTITYSIGCGKNNSTE